MGYAKLMKPLVDANIKVSVILDTPFPGISVPDCVAKNSAPAVDCSFPRWRAGEEADPLQRAASQVPGVQFIDLSDYLCQGDRCPPVVGNVLVFRDNHMTNTFARTLALPLKKALGM